MPRASDVSSTEKERDMKLIRQFSILLAVVFAGEGMNRILGVPLPGSVLGLLLLLLLLMSGWVKLSDVEEVAQFFLTHLAVLFIPAGVGLLAVWGVLQAEGVVLLLISVVATVVVLLVSAGAVLLARRLS